ncbi:sterol desaturase [Haloferax sp. S1W]|uniref:sterol desaturase n=1 Tax=Haloferax sp. S1W TaxID=3377110 RepID=UPI0037CC2DBA
MSHRTVSSVVGFLVAILVSGGLYWLVGNVGLAVVTGILWGTGATITLSMRQQYPSHSTGDAWKDKRWTGLSAGLVTLAATLGVSPTLPVSAELRLGLGFLVVGVGFVGYTAATMAELERKVA